MAGLFEKIDGILQGFMQGIFETYILMLDKVHILLHYC